MGVGSRGSDIPGGVTSPAQERPMSEMFNPHAPATAYDHNTTKWVSPSLTLAYGSAGNHGFSGDRAILGGVDGDRLLGKAVEEEPAHL